MISPLERIATVSTHVEARAPGDQNLLPSPPSVEQPLEQISPATVLVNFVEDPQLGVGELFAQNTLAVAGDVPAQVAERFRSALRSRSS